MPILAARVDERGGTGVGEGRAARGAHGSCRGCLHVRMPPPSMRSMHTMRALPRHSQPRPCQLASRGCQACSMY
eukprot:350655-Chlamydomonas_euryale.AAC.3